MVEVRKVGDADDVVPWCNVEGGDLAPEDPLLAGADRRGVGVQPAEQVVEVPAVLVTEEEDQSLQARRVVAVVAHRGRAGKLSARLHVIARLKGNAGSDGDIDT